MFEQGLVPESSARQGWTFAVSMAAQVAGVALLLLLPLLNPYEIDLRDWVVSRFRLAVPPPPAPPPPAPVPASAPQVARFEADFRAPSVIPDEVTFLHDIGLPVSPIAASPASPGVAGGSGRPGTAGVLGMFPLDTDDMPLPPPIRVGGQVQNARITHRVLPVYPPEAVEQLVAGTVHLEAIIGTDGRVRDLTLVDGHPLLAHAAMEAVAQWRYRPTQLNGRDVEVVTLIEVNFNLTVIDEKEVKRRQRELRRRGRSPGNTGRN